MIQIPHIIKYNKIIINNIKIIGIILKVFFISFWSFYFYKDRIKQLKIKKNQPVLFDR